MINEAELIGDYSIIESNNTENYTVSLLHIPYKI